MKVPSNLLNTCEILAMFVCLATAFGPFGDHPKIVMGSGIAWAGIHLSQANTRYPTMPKMGLWLARIIVIIAAAVYCIALITGYSPSPN